MTIFGALSLHPKIPFPGAGIEREVRARLKPYYGCAAPKTLERPEHQDGGGVIP